MPQKTTAEHPVDRRLHAVLFDMDGTLVDSEKLWSIALNEVAAELGGELSESTRHAMVGTDLVRSIRMLIDDIGVSAEVAVVQHLLVAATARLFRTELTWQPGAQQLLHQVRAAGYATALVTSTHQNLTAIALETIGRENFDVIVCGDDVNHTKPHPEPYTVALSRLQVSPSAAVAIEDSPAGSISATGAGIVTLVVPAEVPVNPGPLMTIVASLQGVTVAKLVELCAAHD